MRHYRWKQSLRYEGRTKGLITFIKKAKRYLGGKTMTIEQKRNEYKSKVMEESK
ncbi:MULTISPECIES: hypothetical protein [Bacillus]|uniref:hypothetical protein n=1 Tax=Bacillus TaxID=1386 RepID=UPI0015D46E60|nr:MULTISPECIES: hypothetical protein [Bacillus cereus group]MBJ8024531.1 hypothetical protein [Bacillus cereus]MBJ8036954.1 hypothetical protein [Bacillus cereus]MEB8651866.1 hypothetical protein [Bacillus cereus]MEB8668867.1 hypothetical protein [Bacillus cereus]HDR3899199.1 hypothetical protein [Bacillus cereus]